MSDIRPLFIDIETFSSVDIKSCGLHKYVESPDFEVLLIAYAYGTEPVGLIDLTDPQDAERIQSFRHMIIDHPITKVAHNNMFERTCLGKLYDAYLEPENWEDTMILAAMNGLPMSLDAMGAALGLQMQKLKEGKALINYFCKPCRPTKTNGGRTRNLPKHDPEKWDLFKFYCRRDVEAEREAFFKMKKTHIPDWERKVCCLDARINERGVRIDPELVIAAIDIDSRSRESHLGEMQRITGLENPNSVAQIKSWLSDLGVECDSLNKAVIDELKAKTNDQSITRALELRQLLGKTSTKKYDAMSAAVCEDGRVRGLLQYYGAGRTGRWAGRLVQVQNLPQNHLDDIGLVREVVKSRDLEMLEMLYDSVPDVLSQLIRTAFVANKEHTFFVADYSAIEARVIAYLAGERWRLDTFAAGGDIYCRSATQMFKVPVEKHGVNGPLRQKGKIAELACGYGGGVAALKAFGADKMGLSEEEMQEIVTNWRLASPTIPRLWRSVEGAAKTALENGGHKVTVSGKTYDPERAHINEERMGEPIGSFSPFFNGEPVCTYRKDADGLKCQLPSGRILTYWGARIEDGSIVFMGQNQTTRKWEKTETWGGKLVENIVQAFARDCLATAMLRLDEAGYKIVFHVHDEIIAEVGKDEGKTWKDMAQLMCEPIEWAPGLPLDADGYETDFYRKD